MSTINLTNTSSVKTIAIAGAGLMGLLSAWRLAVAGHSVQVFEAGQLAQPQSAAHTAAAMISPMSEVVVSERKIYDYGLRSLALWPSWIEQLNQGLDKPVHYQANGSLVVAHGQDVSELEQFYQDLQMHLGVDNDARWLNQHELQQLEPDIANQFQQALYLPNEASLDNRHLLSTLIMRLQNMGVPIHEQHNIEYRPQAYVKGSALTGFDVIVDCRGMGARQSQNKLRGVRGEVLWVETPEVQLQHPIRFMHPRYKLYIVPKLGNRFIIGATEIESEDRSPVSVQSMLELCSALYTLNPAFAEARILELDANLRPALLDNLPAIESKTHGDTLYLSVNGLYRHGYLLAPKLVEDLLLQLDPSYCA